MRTFLARLRGRKAREAQEALERLDQQSAKGPDAARRFEEAARQVIAVPKADVEKQARRLKRRRG
jgi:exoribonuclease R